MNYVTSLVNNAGVMINTDSDQVKKITMWIKQKPKSYKNYEEVEKDERRVSNIIRLIIVYSLTGVALIYLVLIDFITHPIRLMKHVIKEIKEYGTW